MKRWYTVDYSNAHSYKKTDPTLMMTWWRDDVMTTSKKLSVLSMFYPDKVTQFHDFTTDRPRYCSRLWPHCDQLFSLTPEILMKYNPEPPTPSSESFVFMNTIVSSRGKISLLRKIPVLKLRITTSDTVYCMHEFPSKRFLRVETLSHLCICVGIRHRDTL